MEKSRGIKGHGGQDLDEQMLVDEDIEK